MLKLNYIDIRPSRKEKDIWEGQEKDVSTPPLYALVRVSFKYRPFHKTLPRSSAFVNWISARFYETGCILAWGPC